MVKVEFIQSDIGADWLVPEERTSRGGIWFRLYIYKDWIANIKNSRWLDESLA